MSAEARLRAAIEEYFTQAAGVECSFVVRAVIVAEAIYADSADVVPTVEVVGEVPVWAAYGLLGGALELQRSVLADAFRPGTED